MRKLQLETRVCDSCGKESEPVEVGTEIPGWVTTEDAQIGVIINNHFVVMGDVCDTCAVRPLVVAIQAFKQAQLEKTGGPVNYGMTPSEQLAHKQGLAQIAALDQPPVATEVRSMFDGTESDPA